MQTHELSDAQWCFLDLLMRARQKGISRLSRLEILSSPQLPQGAALKLVWAGLTMPSDLVVMHGQHDFAVTDAGAALYSLKFGSDTKPTQIADAVICLPGPEHYAN